MFKNSENINYENNFDNDNLNFIQQINNTRSLSFNNINNKFDKKNKLSNALINNVTNGFNSNKDLRRLNNLYYQEEQQEKQNLGFNNAIINRANENKSNKSLKFNTANNFYSLNNFNSRNNVNQTPFFINDYNNNTNYNCNPPEINFKNSFFNKKEKFSYENSRLNCNRSNKISENNLKTVTEKTQNMNSGLKIPKNFLKFDSDLFSNGSNNFNNHFSKNPLDSLQTGSSNFFFYNIYSLINKSFNLF